MGKLILIRHGESVWNTRSVFTGWIDIPLTQSGIIEAAKAGNIIAGIDIDVVYTKPGGKNVQIVQGTTRTNSSAMTAIGAEITVSKTGTYDVYWSAFRNNTSSGYTWTSQLYVDGTAYGTGNTSFTNNQQNNHLTNVSLTANQKIRVYGSTTRGSSYYISAPTLAIVES